MDLAAFRASLKGDKPPPGLTRPVEALWHAGRGDWDAAHKLVQQDEGEPKHDWVHAHLHRVEGDLSNAGYWYRRAKQPTETGPLDAEWAKITQALLTSP
jgi:hypothetical protein